MSSTSRQRDQISVEVYMCNICISTVASLQSIRRHLKKMHLLSIDHLAMEQYFSIKRFTVPQPPPLTIIATTTTTEKNDDGAGISSTKRSNSNNSSPSSSEGNPKKKSRRDAESQASCMECEKLEKRAQELEAMYKKLKKIAKKTKAVIEDKND